MVHRLVRPAHRKHARDMRTDSTKADNLLWQTLRNRQLEGLKFKRQVPLGDYILDFLCLEARLIVEVDGGQQGSRHETPSAMPTSKARASARCVSGMTRLSATWTASAWRFSVKPGGDSPSLAISSV